MSVLDVLGLTRDQQFHTGILLDNQIFLMIHMRCQNIGSYLVAISSKVGIYKGIDGPKRTLLTDVTYQNGYQNDLPEVEAKLIIK